MAFNFEWYNVTMGSAVEVPYGPTDWGWWMMLVQQLAIASGAAYLLSPASGSRPATSAALGEKSKAAGAHAAGPVAEARAAAASALAEQEPAVNPAAQTSDAAALSGAESVPTSAAEASGKVTLPIPAATLPVLLGAAEASSGGVAAKPALPGGAAPSGGARRPPTRAVYLDSIKIFMTFLVVFHHVYRTFEQENWYPFNIYVCRDVGAGGVTPASCTGHAFKNVFVDWIGALNQSYFMNLFFFISGYFTPSSFDRKGARDFLEDKFKRLGLPALAWFFFFGPLLWVFCLSTVFGADFGYGQGGSWVARGPPWFVTWLLTFNIFYALSGGNPIVMEMPQVGMMLVVGIALGVVQHATPTDFLMAIPLGVQELVPTVLFFAAGAIAKRNKWLDQIEQIPAATMWMLRALAVFLALTSLGLKIIGHLEPSNASRYGTEMKDVFLKGLFCVVISIVELDFFRRFFNTGGRVTKFLADASYAAFLIHPWVITVVAWSFVCFAQASGVEVVKADLAQAGFPRSKYAPLYGFVLESDHDGLLWGCCVYTLVLSVVICWPLAHGLRLLPGLRQVL